MHFLEGNDLGGNVQMLKNFANGWIPDSPAAHLRKKRFSLFLSLLESLPAPVRILDVGGQEAFWKVVGTDHPKIASITLLNLWKEPVGLSKLDSLAGDARNMHQFENKSFDVVFSNSVIEHVGGLREQSSMAREVQRVGRYYFVQTPNRHFPIEPHFLVPLFQYFPNSIRATLHNNFTLGWWKRQPLYLEALAEVESIRLLTKRELAFLFPAAQIYTEFAFGLPKSFVAHNTRSSYNANDNLKTL